MSITFNIEPSVIKMTKLKQKIIDKIFWRGGFYRIAIDSFPMTWPIDLPSDMTTWLTEHIKSKHYKSMGECNIFSIKFKTDEDAMAFKLRWL